ncbi:hypothetical protein SALBM311S_11062 [Streptomyces alboniger]
MRRRTDFSGDDDARVVGAALRLTAEAGQLLSIWRQSPLRVLARLHLAAAAAKGDEVGRPRQEGDPVDEPLIELPPPGAAEVSGRLEGLAELIIAGGSAPALVTAAVVHGELLALRPFTSHNGLVARAAERIVLVGSGLDPKSVCPVEAWATPNWRARRLCRGPRRLCLPALRRAWPPGSPTAAGRSSWVRVSRRRCARRCNAGRRRESPGKGLRRYESSYRRWHVHRGTKRPRCIAHQVGIFARPGVAGP